MVVKSRSTASGKGKELLRWLADDKERSITRDFKIWSLIEGGADLEVRNANGNTPLIFASCIGDRKVVDLLIRNGANINTTGCKGMTALMEAAKNGFSDVVACLASKGADVNARDEDGWTPLMYALHNGEAGAALVLIHKGADLHATNKAGTTIMEHAIEGGFSTENLIEEQMGIASERRAKSCVKTGRDALSRLKHGIDGG